VITEYKEEAHEADASGCWPPEASKQLDPGVIRVLYVNGVPEMCEYLCPCGCRMPCPTFFPTEKRQKMFERPLWVFSRGTNGPTLSPSVRHTGGCKSHYNITDGKVIMHADSGK
jgi:hypothetical protein